MSSPTPVIRNLGTVAYAIPLANGSTVTQLRLHADITGPVGNVTITISRLMNGTVAYGLTSGFGGSSATAQSTGGTVSFQDFIPPGGALSRDFYIPPQLSAFVPLSLARGGPANPVLGWQLKVDLLGPDGSVLASSTATVTGG